LAHPCVFGLGRAAGLTARARRAQTGTIVQATLAQNWTEQAMTYTYASLRPNTVDAAPYAAALAGLATVARGLASGRGAPAGGGGGAPSCNAPLPMLDECAPRPAQSARSRTGRLPSMGRTCLWAHPACAHCVLKSSLK